MQKNQSFHLHMISDATGETLLSLGKAVIVQYEKKFNIKEHIYPMIRFEKQIDMLMENVQEKKGIVIYTIVNSDLSALLEEKCRKINVPCASVLDPIFNIFAEYLMVSPAREVSAQHVLNEEYFKRQESLNYTLSHDDGQLLHNLIDAEVIILGISRTSKTPTSLYLANRGIKTANIPIYYGLEIPIKILENKDSFIVGLWADPQRIVSIRRNRPLGSEDINSKYCDINNIVKELRYAKDIYRKYNIKSIDVTNKAVEETAAEILSMYNKFKEKK